MIKEANEFLKSYWPKHNKKFAVKPVQIVDMHRPLPAGINLDAILCVKTEHVVRNDFTIVHLKKLYQILDRNSPRKVTIEERIDGRMLIFGNNRYLNYKPIMIKPVIKPEPKLTRMTWRPPVNHPWRGPKYKQIVMSVRQEALAVL